MRYKRYQSFGLMLTLPLLLANSETTSLSETRVETLPSPPPEIQPVVETLTESILLQEEPQLTQPDNQMTQPETQNRREGREYCQGIGVC